jgi:phosphopantetheine adenylyltransferase
MPSERFSYTSSRLIKEVLDGGGDVSRFVPPQVESRLRAKLHRT